MTLRCGITTGTCAAAAAKAAAMVLAGGDPPRDVEVFLPLGEAIRVPIARLQREEGSPVVTAAVRKDAGDDPDVTHGLEIRATVSWDDSADVRFAAGEGVGTVTKPGLQVPPGEPAINPVPRRMISAAIRDVTARGVRVEISIPGGRRIAAKTFNPRLGVEGGLSILGTTGIVRPYCRKALHDALKCSLDVAAACGVGAPVLVPGHVGAGAARRHFSLRDEQVVEVGNEWGFALELVSCYQFRAMMIAGHPGKLAKLAAGQWDTHSARSGQAVEYVRGVCQQALERPVPDVPTAEGLFAALESEQRQRLASEVARRVRVAVAGRLGSRPGVAVLLVNMAGDRLGADGDFSPWR